MSIPAPRLAAAAAKNGDIAELDVVLKQYGQETVASLTADGDTVGHIAVRKGHLQFLKKLVHHGLDTHAVNKKGNGLVHEAAQNAQLHILKYLHSIQADFHSLTEEGDSVLDVAKNQAVVTYLESILGTGAAAIASNSGTKKQRCGSRKREETKNKGYSQLMEEKKQESAVPSSTEIVRGDAFEAFDDGDVILPVCDPMEVGWKLEEHQDLGFPRRPPWRKMGLKSAEALHKREENDFRRWVKTVDAAAGVASIFERNLDYWRELWRVIERGDVYIIIVDARNPLLHLSRSFLSFLQSDSQKPVLLCLNKTDLMPPVVLHAWRAYIAKATGVSVLCISCKDDGESRQALLNTLLNLNHVSSSDQSFEEMTIGKRTGVRLETLLLKDAIPSRAKKRLSKKAKARIMAEEVRKQSIQDPIVDSTGNVDDAHSRSDSDSVSSASEEQLPTEYHQQRPVVVSILGEPNVGKSSVINYLLGVKKVSVSSHPGRTKHLQTHFLCPGLVLCDCPGIVFPKMHVPFALQVLYGCYPIARCRDVYAVVGYLAAHITPPLPVVLNIARSGVKWSVLEICEAVAEKNNWRTHRGGRLDIYRAANCILRLALSGKNGVVLAFSPPRGSLNASQRIDHV